MSVKDFFQLVYIYVCLGIYIHAKPGQLLSGNCTHHFLLFHHGVQGKFGRNLQICFVAYRKKMVGWLNWEICMIQETCISGLALNILNSMWTKKGVTAIQKYLHLTDVWKVSCALCQIDAAVGGNWLWLGMNVAFEDKDVQVLYLWLWQFLSKWHFLHNIHWNVRLCVSIVSATCEVVCSCCKHLLPLSVCGCGYYSSIINLSEWLHVDIYAFFSDTSMETLFPLFIFFGY